MERCLGEKCARLALKAGIAADLQKTSIGILTAATAAGRQKDFDRDFDRSDRRRPPEDFDRSDRRRPPEDFDEDTGQKRNGVTSMVDQLFDENDNDGDSKLSRDEIPESGQRIFDRADKNED